jgi:chromosome segregation ATPase
MEAALTSHVNELMKGREEYQKLFDKLKTANMLHEERESRDREHIRELSTEVQDLRHKLHDSSMIIDNFSKMKSFFESKVGEISNMVDKLQKREEDALMSNMKLTKEKEELENEKKELAIEKKDLETRLKYEFVSKDIMTEKDSLLNELKLQMVKLETKLQSESESLLALKKSSVPLKDYKALKEEKHMIEESVKIIDDYREQNEKALEEMNVKLTYQKNEKARSDRSVLTMEKKQKELEQQALDLRSQLGTVKNDLALATERLLSVENSKASLMMQISNTKMLLGRANQENSTMSRSLEEKEKELVFLKNEQKNMDVLTTQISFQREEITQLKEEVFRKTQEIQAFSNAIFSDPLMHPRSNDTNKASSNLSGFMGPEAISGEM